MIGTKCPGQDMRYWTSDDVYEEKCPHCGKMIEFFKTDIRLRCPNCKNRVANPRFDMGCAQWCAYAEQCLGPAARGLKSQSLKLLLGEQLKEKVRNKPDLAGKISKALEDAEKSCSDKQLDMLPALAALLVLSLEKYNLIDNASTYIDELKKDNSFPQAALKDTRQIIENVSGNNLEGPLEQLVVSLLSKIDE